MANEKRFFSEEEIMVELYDRVVHGSPTGTQFANALIWRIKALWYWLVEYITLTPKKHYKAIYKLECLLCHATGGRYSKAGYALADMERMVTDYIEECCNEAVEEALKERDGR